MKTCLFWSWLCVGCELHTVAAAMWKLCRPSESWSEKLSYLLTTTFKTSQRTAAETTYISSSSSRSSRSSTAMSSNMWFPSWILIRIIVLVYIRIRLNIIHAIRVTFTLNRSSSSCNTSTRNYFSAVNTQCKFVNILVQLTCTNSAVSWQEAN